MSISKLLADIAKSSRDRALGRIHSLPGNWVFAEDAPPLKSDEDPQHRMPRKDADGREMVIIGQKSVCCPNGELWQGKKPRTTQGEKSYWWVSRRECSGCQFYQKRERGGGPSFSRCLWKATARNARDATLQGIGEAGQALNTAHDFARKITNT